MLYTGVTRDLHRRVWQHKTGSIPGFTSRYKATRLVWYELTPNSRAAIAREQQIKGWKRERKLVLIEAMNPEWQDLADSWSQP